VHCSLRQRTHPFCFPLLRLLLLPFIKERLAFGFKSIGVWSHSTKWLLEEVMISVILFVTWGYYIQGTSAGQGLFISYVQTPPEFLVDPFGVLGHIQEENPPVSACWLGHPSIPVLCFFFLSFFSFFPPPVSLCFSVCKNPALLESGNWDSGKTETRSRTGSGHMQVVPPPPPQGPFFFKMTRGGIYHTSF
jgi:hypothetical protein